jgi:hypothetical protein
MPEKPIVAYRDPTTPDCMQRALPDWAPSTIVFVIGMLLFAIIEVVVRFVS